MRNTGVRELTLRIVLEDPPAGVDFGLQIGRGAEYETLQTQRSKGKDLSFEFSVGVGAGAAGSKISPPPDFHGPMVQGPPSQRFIYIDIGTYAGQRDTPWSRRLKVPLVGITSEMVDRATKDAGMVVETRVPGTGKDGGPNCATVKPFDGWSVALR
jgi:hypothetical protein